MFKYLIVALSMCFVATGFTQTVDNFAPIHATKAGAISGYDPVAYFTAKQPVKGLTDITFVWKGATWHFANKENRQLFQVSPEKYAPQYGGYCAYGWAQGYPVKIDPNAWTIVDGKLYLNYSKKVQKLWEEDKNSFIESANVNWKKANQNK